MKTVRLNGQLIQEGIAYFSGINTQYLNTIYASQRKSLWCWAACIEMILRYFGAHLNQEQIVGEHFGYHPDGSPCNCAGNDEIINTNLNLCRRDNKWSLFCANAPMRNGFPDWWTLQKQLAADYPVLIVYRSSPTTNHAVIITGMTFFIENGVMHITELVIRDPSRDPLNKSNNGRKTFKGGIELNNFVSQALRHWYPKVSFMHQNDVIWFDSANAELRMV